MSMNGRLSGKVIIVTGSTTGVGEAIARRYAAEGAKIVVHGLEEELGRKVAESLGDAAIFIKEDLADAAAAERLVAAAVQRFGHLNGLVNNAAWIVRSDLVTTDAALFDRAMAINVRAPLLLIRAAMPYLRQRQGSVLNIGSINAYCGEINQLAYSISKGALMTLSRNLADAFGPERVRINHLNLGWVLSENENRLKIREGLAEDWAKHPPVEFAPSGRLIMPEDVAAAAVYWLGDESRPISGSVLDFNQYPVVGRNPPKSAK